MMKITEAEEFQNFARMSPEEQARIRAEVAERKAHAAMVREKMISWGLDPDLEEDND